MSISIIESRNICVESMRNMYEGQFINMRNEVFFDNDCSHTTEAMFDFDSVINRRVEIATFYTYFAGIFSSTDCLPMT
jgi:hypothetical protein